MKKLIFFQLLVMFIFVNVSIIAQTNNQTFTHSKSNGDIQTVYFKIIGMSDDLEEENRIVELLVSDENIYKVDLFNNDNFGEVICKAEIKFGIQVDYVKKIINSAGYELELSNRTNLNSDGKPKGIYFSDWFSFHEEFNGMKGYDQEKSMAISPEDYYDMQKEKWIHENPDKYANAKQKNDTIIIIRQKDMQVYSETKRQYILEHPEKYQIIE